MPSRLPFSSPDLSSCMRHQATPVLAVLTSLIYLATCPSVVFSISALACLASSSSFELSSSAVMMGVEISLEPLMISLSRGTPSVTFIDATPAKWNVLSVI
jgi:hypothetical protein